MALNKRKQQAIDTKNCIYETAQTLFEKNGFDNVKISDICHEAGVSIGSFYNYFDSKEQLILSRIDDFDRSIYDVCQEIENSQISYTEKLCRTLQLPAHTASKYPPVRNALFLMIILKTHSNAYLNGFRLLDKYISYFLVKAVEHKELIIESEIDSVATALLQVTRGVLYDWTLRSGDFDLVKQTNDVTMHYLKPYFPVKI